MSLLKFNPRISKITVKGFVVNAQYNTEASKWNFALLKLESDGSGGLGIIRARNGSLKLSETSGNSTRDIAIIKVSDWLLKPLKSTENAYDFYISVIDPDEKDQKGILLPDEKRHGLS